MATKKRPTQYKERLEKDHWREGSTKGSRWSVVQHEKNIHRIIIENNDTRMNVSQWFLLSSDRHHDNAHTDQALESRHLKECQKRRGIVLDFGDLFCAMQGKWDPRSDTSALRPEHQEGHYLDRLVKTAAEFYQPYSDSFGLITRGNHETAIIKRHQHDLTEALTARLSANSKVPVFNGGYTGWIIIGLYSGGSHFSLKMHYTHGLGAGGIMSHGTLATRRIASFISDADIMVSGHTHDSWQLTLASQRLITSNGVYRTQIVPVHHIKCGTYKDEYGTGYGGWHIETGKPPKVLGAVWMRLKWEGDYDGGGIAVEFMRAD